MIRMISWKFDEDPTRFSCLALFGTWRMLRVPDWRLGGSGHLWHHGSSWYVILDLCAKFQLSSMNMSVSRTTHPRSHTWRTRMVPDWILGGWGHSWHHGSSWYVILDLCAEFQLSSINRSVSRTPPSSKSYFEDIDGSWMDTCHHVSSWYVILDLCA